MIALLKSNARGVFLGVLTLLVFQSLVLHVWALDDPGVPGPLAVSGKEYVGTNITLPGFPGPVEQQAVVWHPSNMTGNVFPLIILLHGRHVTCFQGSTVRLEFPCSAGFQSIPNYRGYDYLAQSLASNGYIVVSIGANGINARDNAVSDLGALARAQLIQRHLDIWRSFNAGNDPFGGIFRGRVNLNNVGTMGHSRGGEGVVRHFLYNASLGSPYRIGAVLPLAPVNFSRFVINRVPLGVLLPYCDGDVSDLPGVHFYDDVRYNVSDDQAAKHTFLVLGANHNFYNTIWTPGLFPAGTADDWFTPATPGATTDPHCGSFGTGRRLTAAQQRATALAYVKAFFRAYLANRTEFLPYLSSEAPPPPSAQGAQIHASYHAAANMRRDINRLLTTSNLTTNTLGGSVGQSGITPYTLCGGNSPQPQHCLPSQSVLRQPHTAPSSLSTKRGLSQLQFGWTSAAASYSNQVPAAYANVSAFTSLQLRAAIDFSSSRNPLSSPQDFSVVLVDAAGRQASVRVGAYSRALFFPPGSGVNLRAPKVILNTVRVPLAAFTGIDKTNIRTVRLALNQRSSGALLMSDIAFAK